MTSAIIHWIVRLLFLVSLAYILIEIYTSVPYFFSFKNVLSAYFPIVTVLGSEETRVIKRGKDPCYLEMLQYNERANG